MLSIHGIKPHKTTGYRVWNIIVGFFRLELTLWSIYTFLPSRTYDMHLLIHAMSSTTMYEDHHWTFGMNRVVRHTYSYVIAYP